MSYKQKYSKYDEIQKKYNKNKISNQIGGGVEEETNEDYVKRVVGKNWRVGMEIEGQLGFDIDDNNNFQTKMSQMGGNNVGLDDSDNPEELDAEWQIGMEIEGQIDKYIGKQTGGQEWKVGMEIEDAK